MDSTGGRYVGTRVTRRRSPVRIKWKYEIVPAARDRYTDAGKMGGRAGDCTTNPTMCEQGSIDVSYRRSRVAGAAASAGVLLCLGGLAMSATAAEIMLARTVERATTLVDNRQSDAVIVYPSIPEGRSLGEAVQKAVVDLPPRVVPISMLVQRGTQWAAEAGAA